MHALTVALQGSSAGEPLLPQLDATPVVHVEKSHRGTADTGEPLDDGTVELKMLFPAIASRIENLNLFARLRVDRG